jgi:DNA-binding GntR family transcriptional regulator
MDHRSNGTTNKPTLSDGAYSELRRSLIDGTFPAGARLSEPELALRFRTSRSPIREALVRLEHEGFVERASNGRVSVKALEIADLEQLYVLRAAVEGLAARLAAHRLRPIDLEAMSRIVDKMERCVKKGSSAEAIAAGQEFHDVITRECGNHPLVEVLTGLHARISRFRAVVASFRDYDEERVAEHRRILKAFYQRKPEQAETEMIRHVNRSAAVLIGRLQTRTAK